MQAIRAAHAFDGTQFLPGGATVLVDGDRIVGVDTGGSSLPDGVEVTEYDGTVLPGLFDCHTHLVADATFGGLERAGAMTDEAIDMVIAESLRAHAAGRRDDRPGLGRPRLPDARFPEAPRPTPRGRVGAAAHDPRWALPLPRRSGGRRPARSGRGARRARRRRHEGDGLGRFRDAGDRPAGRPVHRAPNSRRWSTRRTRRASRRRARPLARRDAERPGGRRRRDRALHRPLVGGRADRRRPAGRGGPPRRGGRPHHGQRPQPSRAHASTASACRSAHGAVRSRQLRRVLRDRGSECSAGFASTGSPWSPAWTPA